MGVFQIEVDRNGHFLASRQFSPIIRQHSVNTVMQRKYFHRIFIVFKSEMYLPSNSQKDFGFYLFVLSRRYLLTTKETLLLTIHCIII